MNLLSFFVLSIFCAAVGLFIPIPFPGAAVGLIFGAAMSIFILLMDVMKSLDYLEKKMEEKSRWIRRSQEHEHRRTHS